MPATLHPLESAVDHFTRWYRARMDEDDAASATTAAALADRGGEAPCFAPLLDEDDDGAEPGSLAPARSPAPPGPA